MKNKEKNFVSAVIYVYNAECRIENFLRETVSFFDEHFEHSEIICVNDCSDDDSVSVIRKVSRQAGATSISLLNMSYYHGIELAMNAGVDLAIGDFVFEFDSTVLDYEINEILAIYRKALEGYDIVSASPDERARLSSRLFYFVFERYGNVPSRMHTERFRILSRRVINRISSMNKSVLYRKAVYANCGLKTDYIFYQPTDQCKEEGKLEKQERKYRKRLAIDTLILFTEVGYRFSMTMTAFMIIMAIGMALYSIVTYAVSNPVEGWTTTVLFLSFSFFGVFGILTIIIKYLQILVDLIFRRKRYSFEDIEKLTK